MFLLCFLLFLTIYSNTNDFFDNKIKSLHSKVCPYIGYEGKTCPGGNNREINEAVYYDLMSYDSVTHEQKYPIINKEASTHSERDMHPLKVVYSPMKFKSTQEYFDNYLSFDLKSFRNGVFRKITDAVKFFNTYFKKDQGKKTFITVTQKDYNNHHLSINPNDLIVLKDEVNDIINDFLPEYYDVEMYAKFVEAFGTHIAYSCEYGGSFEKQVFVKNCLFDDFSESKFEKACKDDIEYFIAHPDKQKQQGGDPVYVKKTSVHTTAIYGGDPTKTKPKQIHDRILSFYYDPVATSCKFLSIENVFYNSKKKANIKKFLTEYKKKPKQDLQKALNSIKSQEKTRDLKRKVPSVLVSDNGLQYGHVKLSKGQTSSAVQFHYGQSVNGVFYCKTDEKDNQLKTSCWLNEYYNKHPGSSYWNANGDHSVGNIKYTWRVCHGHLFWKHCHDEYAYSDTHVLIDCEQPKKAGKTMSCICPDW